MKFQETRITNNATTNHTANLIFNNQKLLNDVIFQNCRISIMNGSNEYLTRNSSNGYAHLYIVPETIVNGKKYMDWDNSYWVYVSSNTYNEKKILYPVLNEHIKSNRLKILVLTRKGWDLIPFSRLDTPDKTPIQTKKGKINFIYKNCPLLLNEATIYFSAPNKIDEYVHNFTDAKYLMSVNYEKYRAKKPIKFSGENSEKYFVYKSLKQFYDKYKEKINVSSYETLKKRLLRGKGKIEITSINNKKIFLEQIKGE